MSRLRWTYGRMRHMSRGRLSGTIVIAVAIAAIAYAIYVRHRSPGNRAMFVSALEGLALTVAAWVVVMLVYGTWTLVVRSKDGLLIQELSPGPEHVAAAAERVRNLRSRLSLIHAELLAIRDSLRRFQTRGRYWDPSRGDDLLLVRLTESGGQLGEDPRTSPAFQACAAVDRELTRLNRLVRDRWSDGMAGEMLSPSEVFFEPDVHAGDDLDQTFRLIRQADDAISNALRVLAR